MSTLPPMPVPRDPHVQKRVEHQRLRRRVLYSSHREDVSARIASALGVERQAAWGEPDLTSNVALRICEWGAQLYGKEPVIQGEPGHEAVAEALADAGAWPLMQRVQRDTIGLREMLLRVEVVEGRLTLCPVFPDMVYESRENPRNPGVPEALTVLERWGERWVLVTTDIGSELDGLPPRRFAVDAETQEDVSEAYLGHPPAEGEAYPFRDAEGRPFLNYVVYHAAETGYLFDWRTWTMVFEGTLTICVYLTFFGHMLRNTSWPQRYTVNLTSLTGDIVGADSSDTRRMVTVDPGVVVEFRTTEEEGGQFTVGQWSVAGDPEAVLRSVQAYKGVIEDEAGVQLPGVSRQDADVRSGYSLAVQRDSMREAQRRYEPIFRVSDLELLGVSAKMLNLFTGSSYPESGYRITYAGLPPSPIEERAEREHVIQMIEAGLLLRRDALRRLHPEWTNEEATAYLALVDAEQQRGSANV